MLTFTKRPGPHADTAWAVVGQLAQLKLWLACSRELMSCVGRLCKEYLYLYNSLPLIPTPPHIMAVNIGEAVGCPLPPKPPWLSPTCPRIQTGLELQYRPRRDLNMTSSLVPGSIITPYLSTYPSVCIGLLREKVLNWLQQNPDFLHERCFKYGSTRDANF